ncbi:hypothetical protein [Acrocarpospora sp. B8E8]|uniref:hypothetical protein n=1 Tax=Acrocarpospora sp. B8E8 TaxID=3153572 RepID=UPI00325DF2EE
MQHATRTVTHELAVGGVAVGHGPRRHWERQHQVVDIDDRVHDSGLTATLEQGLESGHGAGGTPGEQFDVGAR